MSWILDAKIKTKEQQEEEEAILRLTVERTLSIVTAREISPLKQYTVEQAKTYINNKLNAALTAAEMKEAVRDILLKMIPYVLQ